VCACVVVYLCVYDCMCVHVWLYICVRMTVYLRMKTDQNGAGCIFAYMGVRLCVFVCLCGCTCAHERLRNVMLAICVQMYVCVFIYVCICECICAYEAWSEWCCHIRM